MSELTRFTNSPVASGIGVLKRKWKSIRFFFEKRAFESKIEGILRAAAGHEGNSLPAGESQYRLLGSTAESLFLAIFTIPLALFLLGTMAGLVSVGFHLVGGR